MSTIRRIAARGRLATLKCAGPLALAALAIPATSSALTIGYYDITRENWGFSDAGVGASTPYLSQAKQWLVDQGHTLVATNNANSAFLSGVDAFYTGLLDTGYSAEELTSFESFVNDQGGFLFIQTDWAVGTWTSSANTVLGNWGISHGGNFISGSMTTVGTSEWVSNPNAVTSFGTSQHSVVETAPSDFETLAVDHLGRTVLGVFDAGAGRSSDVLIATDINFFDDSVGWTQTANRNLWENIWKAVSDQVEEDDDDPVQVPEPSSLLLLGLGLVAFGTRIRRRKHV